MFWLLHGFKTPFLRIKVAAELIISWVLLDEVITFAFVTKYFLISWWKPLHRLGNIVIIMECWGLISYTSLFRQRKRSVDGEKGMLLSFRNTALKVFFWVTVSLCNLNYSKHLCRKVDLFQSGWFRVYWVCVARFW